MLSEKTSSIKLLLTDCDGVLTDAGVYYGEAGEQLKKFNIRDGMAVERLRNLANIDTGIVTGELSPSVTKRAQKLKITELHLGAKDKPAVLKEILGRLNLDASEVAYIGDDSNDLAIMELVGLTAAPADALPFVKEKADYVCAAKGGKGAFREFAELLIRSNGKISEYTGINKTYKLSTGNRIGVGEPCYIIAEIGINHNGSLEIAKQLIDEAVAAKASAVKFQKRTPEICVPKDQWEIMRDTPWGRMSYIDYKRKTEFGVVDMPLLTNIAGSRVSIGSYLPGMWKL